MKAGESFGPPSKVKYDEDPSRIVVRHPTWYGHISYYFWIWEDQWYHEKAEHTFGMGKVN